VGANYMRLSKQWLEQISVLEQGRGKIRFPICRPTTDFDSSAQNELRARSGVLANSNAETYSQGSVPGGGSARRRGA